jgi:hypothetical protein
MRKVVLLRVGIDSGSGGIQGPLFSDGTFELVCIPDKKRVSEYTYGTYFGRNGIPHSAYFPIRKRAKAAHKHIHLDPEFETFTYGDPTPPKRSLRKLEQGDFLVFYCGLKEWDGTSQPKSMQPPGLFIIGYFEVEEAGMATQFSRNVLNSAFGRNFHVRYRSVFNEQRDRLVLVKGGKGSRLLKSAHRISSVGTDRTGKSLKVLSPKMRRVFGDFGGHVSIQRSPPRWVDPEFVEKAIDLVTKLP